MSFHFRSALLVVFVSAGLGLAQDDGKKETPKRNDVEVRLDDGSTMRVVIAQESLTVATRYGKLTVPMNEIVRIDLGLRMPEGAAAKIDKAIRQLGSEEFKEREAAGAELLTFGVLAYQPLQRAAKNTDAEVAQRANDLLKRIRAKVPAEQLRIKDYDVVKTSAFAIVGRIEDVSLNARTAHFGEVKLNFADMRSLRSLARAVGTEVSVDAAKYCVPGGKQWLDTGVEVEALAELTVTASGQINPAPNVLGPGANAAGPAGNARNIGMGTIGHPIGALIGRIGENGQIFLIGERYAGKPATGGKLYVRIVEGPWGVNGSGSYTVKINDDGLPPRAEIMPAPAPAPGGLPGNPPPPPPGPR